MLGLFKTCSGFMHSPILMGHLSTDCPLSFLPVMEPGCLSHPLLLWLGPSKEQGFLCLGWSQGARMGLRLLFLQLPGALARGFPLVACLAGGHTRKQPDPILTHTPP
jgi:hypothetical protein